MNSHRRMPAAGYAQEAQVFFCLWKAMRPQRLQAVWVLVCLLPKLLVPFVCSNQSRAKTQQTAISNASNTTQSTHTAMQALLRRASALAFAASTSGGKRAAFSDESQRIFERRRPRQRQRGDACIALCADVREARIRHSPLALLGLPSVKRG
jgi:hypothetical protein